ncbi:hypothetical protein D869_gp219 [Caulobacter phage CcrRogue]|uniref:Uncharacterized protein n=1 Tax=Caulobacter phage CcrRogue TaxID=2927986 RepID=K4JQX9_9CAUD|nr:hypothetical protein D869_gp219 [Caulobacter phage CcrRogue]AFU86695.1 hypothetical protein CcrRogue_gp213 [Caulobacter phage CcrRogue]
MPSHDPFWLQGFYPLPRGRETLPDAARTWKLHSTFDDVTDAALDVDHYVGKDLEGSWRVVDIRTGLVVHPAHMAGQQATEDGGPLPIYAVESYGGEGYNRKGKAWTDHSGFVDLATAKATLNYLVHADPVDSTGFPTKFRIIDIRTGEVIDEQALIGDTGQSSRLLEEADKLMQAAKLLKQAAAAKTIKGRFAKEDKARDILLFLRN